MSDKRYIRIEDRPVVVVAVRGKSQQSAALLGRLKTRLADEGVGNPFLIMRCASAGDVSLIASWADVYDAALDLPDIPVPSETGEFSPLDKNGVTVVPYGVVASRGVARAHEARGVACPRYQAVTLGRDDTARKPQRPLVYTRFNVQDYRRWLDAAIAAARDTHREDRRFVFVNAWNAWNEGLFLEPDRQGGYTRLNETTRALLDLPVGHAHAEGVGDRAELQPRAIPASPPRQHLRADVHEHRGHSAGRLLVRPESSAAG